MKKFYITTPIYYPSGNFHIGHCYTTILADSIARYKRLQGFDVFFQTGTDEHGQKIQKKAEEKGLKPMEYIDPIVDDAKDLWNALDISYDNFIRTTDKKHIEGVQKIFEKLYNQGDIYLGEYKGMYCTPCESFWTNSQLIDGKCPDCKREVHEANEKAYFFRLSKYQKRLEKYIDDNPEFIQPVSRKNEMINNFLKPGLEDLCVSRTSFDWGIPVTFDDKHVVYVWLDALTNYITSLGYMTNDDDLLKKYWPADLHLVGKEIVRFHTIIWPIILLALGLELPKKVFGHGWLVINGDKISKSLGNYKDPREYIKKYSCDAIRYYSLREVTFGNDGNFSEDSLIKRINSDLANTLGNLVNRTIGMIHKYNNDVDKELIANVLKLKDKVESFMDDYKISDALNEIFDIYKKCNKYIDDTMPWKLKSENENRLNTVLYNLVESIRIATVILQAFLPSTSKKIFNLLNIEEISYLSIDEFGLYKNNTKVNEAEVIFKRIEQK